MSNAPEDAVCMDDEGTLSYAELVAASGAPEQIVREMVSYGGLTPRGADTATWIRGAHSLKVGADVNHDDIFNFFPGFFGGSYTFNSLASFNRGIPNGSGESYQQNFGGIGTTGAETHPNIFEFAAFVQDEWRVRKELTLTMGVRYDLQSFQKPAVRNPDPQLAAAGIDTSFLKTDTNNVGPRLGLARTPNAKTVFRAIVPPLVSASRAAA